MSKIEINHLSVDYVEKSSKYTALEDLSFNVEAGEFVSVIGSSGCGKSTLLSILEGLRKPSEGNILIDGKEIDGTGTNRGVVFQNYSLFPWMSARKNVAFTLYSSNMSRIFKVLSPPHAASKLSATTFSVVSTEYTGIFRISLLVASTLLCELTPNQARTAEHAITAIKANAIKMRFFFRTTNIQLPPHFTIMLMSKFGLICFQMTLFPEKRPIFIIKCMTVFRSLF